jgi:hypothetical protein
MYINDHDGVFPQGSDWCDQVARYRSSDEMASRSKASVQTVFVCPSAPRLRCGYAYNAALQGVRENDIENPASTIMIFESDGGWNTWGGKDLLPGAPRHRRQSDVYAWADGHVEYISRGSAPSTTEWTPQLRAAGKGAAR